MARVRKEAYPDFTQYDKKNKYYEPRATKEKPYWHMVDIEFVSKFKEPATLQELRETRELEGMSLLKKGQRLSVQRVTPKEWRKICRMAGAEFPGD